MATVDSREWLPLGRRAPGISAVLNGTTQVGRGWKLGHGLPPVDDVRRGFRLGAPRRSHRLGDISPGWRADHGTVWLGDLLRHDAGPLEAARAFARVGRLIGSGTGRICEGGRRDLVFTLS